MEQYNHIAINGKTFFKGEHVFLVNNRGVFCAQITMIGSWRATETRNGRLFPTDEKIPFVKVTHVYKDEPFGKNEATLWQDHELKSIRKLTNQSDCCHAPVSMLGGFECFCSACKYHCFLFPPPSFEEEFGIDVPDEDTQGLKTVQDVVDYIKSKQG